MLWKLSTLRGYSLRATDGSLGSVADVLFDDEAWTVRWLVVDTGWLFGRRVLLAPSELQEPDDRVREFPINMSKERIKEAPDVSTEKPVSRQHETDLHAYYGYTPYWGAAGMGVMPILPPADRAGALMGEPEAPAGGHDPVAGEVAAREAQERDVHLRSGRAVTGYELRARDGAIGSIDDVVLDANGWIIRYFVVDTGNWLPGRKVLISPAAARDISFVDETIAVDLSRDQVKASPELDANSAIDREFESRLYSHYGWSAYWT